VCKTFQVLLCRKTHGNVPIFSFIYVHFQNATVETEVSDEVERFTDLWKATSAGKDNLFAKTCSKAYRDLSQNGSDYCLLLSGTMITSKAMRSIPDYHITLEMDIKLSKDKSASGCSNIFSYECEERKTVSLRACTSNVANEMSLRVSYSLQSKNEISGQDYVVDQSVPFSLLTDVFYRIAFTWNKNDRVVQVSLLRLIV